MEELINYKVNSIKKKKRKKKKEKEKKEAEMHWVVLMKTLKINLTKIFIEEIVLV